MILARAHGTTTGSAYPPASSGLAHGPPATKRGCTGTVAGRPQSARAACADAGSMPGPDADRQICRIRRADCSRICVRVDLVKMSVQSGPPCSRSQATSSGRSGC